MENKREGFSFIKSVKNIKSVVVGVDNAEQTKETFSKLKGKWDSK